jgi:hypothetical protein
MEKVTTMRKIRTIAAYSLVATAASAGFVQPGLAVEGCDAYGRLALQQQKDNEQLKCGFSGREWSSDLKAQIAWCQSVGPQDWQEMLKKRNKMLEECRSKK